MQVLMLQFVDPTAREPLPVFRHEMGRLAAMLKDEGFGCTLVAMNGHRPDLLHRAVIEHRPQYILVELRPCSVTAARRTIVAIAERYCLPVAVFGPFATCKPARSVSIPGTRAVIPGEYVRPCVELMRAARDGADADGIAGTWVNTEDGLIKSDLPPLEEDLDAQPFPDRELFDYGRQVELTGEVEFKTSRGCPMWCAYCVNDWYMDLYAGKGEFVRRRSPGNVLEEIARTVSRYDGAQQVVFRDHCFATDEEWLGEFTSAYPHRCALPFSCHVRLESVTRRMAAMLSAGNCRQVHTHVGSGSRFIREEILSIHLSDRQIVGACRALKRAGMHIAAEVFVGSPYESEITIEETLSLLRRCDVDEVHPKVFYPIPGTRAAELCAENGWVSGRGEENYWKSQSVLDMPALSPQEINAIAARLPSLVRRSRRTTLRSLLDRLSRVPRRGPAKPRRPTGNRKRTCTTKDD